METFFIKALQLILSLSILVIVHEFGHFLFARMFKIRVEKFYLFFNPGFSLFKYKPKSSDTEYGIGWLPLGGYVKIAGMVDESMDKEQLAKPAQPWEFRSKPAWQRLLVMVGGVLFNIILAILIYAMVVFYWGDSYISFKDMNKGMAYSEVVQEVGFKDGDKILSADGKELKLRGNVTLDMNTLLQFANAKEIVVERNGEAMTINPPEDFADRIIASKTMAYDIFVPAVVDSIVENTPAQRAGLAKGDVLLAVNDVATESLTALKRQLNANVNKEIKLSYQRGDSVLTTSVAIDSVPALGFVASVKDVYTPSHQDYNILQSIPAGVLLSKETLTGYVAQLRFVFTKEGVSNLGGFAAIGGLFPAQWNWQAFWLMTAFLSVILAIMNILPIPALDGGHVMFLLYEVITRRKPNEKFMEYAQIAGMVFLFALLIYANGNDIFKAIFK